MRVTDLILNLIFPPKCVLCGETLIYRATTPFCPICRSRYEQEKALPCPECGEKHELCECASERMKRYGKAIHIGEYVKEETALRSMILFAKDSSYEYLYRFQASELAALVRRRLDDCEDFVVTYAPRKASKVAKYGIDQAKETSRRVAKLLSIPHYTVLKHIESDEQKRLTAEERSKNAKRSYRLSKDADGLIRGKRVILYDDVVTSGATMVACASLLKKAGAKEIVFLSVGRTCLGTGKKEAGLPKAKKGYYKSKGAV